MSGQPTQEQWDEAVSTAHGLSPTPNTRGLFIYSDAPPNVCGSGVGSFAWFRTERQMLRFVHDHLAWWHPGPSSIEPEDIAARVQSIVDSIDPDNTDLARLRARLNKFMTCLWHIEWWGQFKGLCEGRAKFPVNVRKSFLEGNEDPPSGTKIPRNQMGKFKEFLQEYGF